MLDAQKAYGSKLGLSTENGFSCGRLLFSILPEDAFDHQPIERNGYRLVADVRLDNRSDLASALAIRRLGWHVCPTRICYSKRCSSGAMTLPEG